MEALEFLEKKNKMCETRSCKDCPLSFTFDTEEPHLTCCGFADATMDEPEMVVAVVEKWVGENN